MPAARRSVGILYIRGAGCTALCRHPVHTGSRLHGALSASCTDGESATRRSARILYIRGVGCTALCRHPVHTGSRLHGALSASCTYGEWSSRRAAGIWTLLRRCGAGAHVSGGRSGADQKQTDPPHSPHRPAEDSWASSSHSRSCTLVEQAKLVQTQAIPNLTCSPLR